MLNNYFAMEISSDEDGIEMLYFLHKVSFMLLKCDSSRYPIF